MIYDFNMKGVTIPSFFTQNAKFNSFNSCGVQLKMDYLQDIRALYLQVGKKYYMLRNQSHLIAFKVLGVGITRVDNPCCGNYDIYYKVMYPNGKIEWLDGYSLNGGKFCSWIFESEEKFHKYVETNNARYMHLAKSPILVQFMKFCGEDNILEVINGVLTYPCYVAKKFRAIKTDCRFKVLWFDESGLHFQAIMKDESAYDNQQYPTKEECEASLSITDFYDETDNTKNVCDEITIFCVKSANKNEVIESITKLGLDVNWVLYK